MTHWCSACHGRFRKGDQYALIVFGGAEIVSVCAKCWDRINTNDRPQDHAWRRAQTSPRNKETQTCN